MTTTKKLRWTASDSNTPRIRFFHAKYGKTLLTMSFFACNMRQNKWEVTTGTGPTRRVLASASTRKAVEERLAAAIANTWGLFAL